jgi:general secretion pathway protein K
MNQPSHNIDQKRGVALIIVMWVLVIVSLIVSSFAFEMNLESKIISMQRKRFQADQLALAGIEVAKMMLDFQEDPLEGDDVIYEDPLLEQASRIAEGVPAKFTEELGNGTITISIDYEKGKRNIHKLTSEEWQELFIQTGVPATDRDQLIGTLTDWEDEDELQHLNGAEKDDSFYRERGYEPKNAPIDTIDELLMIKGWTEEVLYGTPAEKRDETENPMTGLARNLTTWGESNTVNPNSATEEVLYSYRSFSESEIEDMLEERNGLDGIPGTEDDGLTTEDLEALGLDPKSFDLKPEYVKIAVESDVGGVKSRISAIFNYGEKNPLPLFWLEGEEIEK